MTFDKIHVLLVEDNTADARLLREAVREVEGNLIQLTHVDTLAKALALLSECRFDVVMLDLSLPDADGLDTLVTTHNRAPAVPIVVLTGHDDEDLAIRAVREGAQDYLVKGQVTSQLLVRAMRYATERKRAIEALQRSEEYFRSLIENALDVITVLDAKGRVRYGSPSFERVLGFPAGALTGTSLFDLIHPEDVLQVQEILQTGTEPPGLAHSLEMRLRHRNGAWRVFESIGKSFDAAAALDGFVLNSRDITERRRSEEELRKLNDTLRAVIEASPLAIYALDLDGNVRSWNTAAQQMFGYSPEEVINRPLPINASDDELAFRKRISEASRGHMAAGVEQVARCKDGSAIDVSIWNAIQRDARGAVDGIVEAVADNTERKRLEEQFRQVQKMEAVGRLAGGVAHDFNNLLTVITGYCQMLLDQLGPDHSMSADMEQILKAADRATALTRHLLAFGRRQIVQPKVVDPATHFLEMRPMLNQLLGETRTLIINSIDHSARIRVDLGTFEQVIVNLVLNARDAMPRGGTVTIEIRNAYLDYDRARLITLTEGEYIVIDVRDTGTGMTQEIVSHLFEPFFTTKEKGRGTGLGLSTSYGTIKQNRGEILVQSTPGVGSTFSIYLPKVSDEVEVKAPPEEPSRTYGGTEVILLAEDEDGVRNLVTEMLRRQGYTVLSTNGGQAALEIASSGDRRIDLLITDVVMPGMGGWELAGHLRITRPDLKFLFVSGYTDGGLVHEGEIDSGTAFLHKPFSSEELARKVREVLEQNAAQTI